MTSAQTTETEKPWRSLPVFLFQIEKAEAHKSYLQMVSVSNARARTRNRQHIFLDQLS